MRRVCKALPLYLAVIAIGFTGASNRPEAHADRHHRVRAGQTLARIARRYRVSVFDLRAANRLRSDRLREGQSIVVPDRGVVYVRPGDTLSRVARRHDVSAEELRRTNRLRRNPRLRAYQRLHLPGYAPPERLDQDWGTPDHPGQVTLVRRGARTTIQLVDTQRNVRREALLELGSVMRRHEDDEVKAAHPRLALLLAHLSDQFGGRPITLVSGFRSVGGYTRETSRHTQGRAADIRIRGVANRTLWERCRRMQHVGCGYYPRSTFVHVDARLRRTQWVDWSRPGRRPRYGNLRGPRRRSRRRIPFPRAQADLPIAISILEADGSVVPFDDSADQNPTEEEIEADESGWSSFIPDVLWTDVEDSAENSAEDSAEDSGAPL
ncbi:MAG: LysM peptidoglycan-binding domain-containing protein [Myxococcota bacterium]